MQGFHTPGSSTEDEHHGDVVSKASSSRSNNEWREIPADSNLKCHELGDPLNKSRSADSENADTIVFDDDQNDQLLKSFDMIFRLHQRSEEIRAHLERIDRILLNSRSVEALADSIVAVLETELDLVAVRFLFKEDHPIASIFRRHPSHGVGIISEDFLDNEGLFRSEPFVLDDPAGNLSHRLFGDTASLIASAAVAPLCHEEEELGLLCLGSDDPCRYCGGMNTDLIASMAAKISLGILNAWAHQNSVRRAFTTGIDEVYTEPFFNEYLEKEFSRAWRSSATFSLLAVSWRPAYQEASACPDAEVIELLQTHLRSSDLAAHGEAVKLWVLLPDTSVAGAEAAGKRLTDVITQYFDGELNLYIGSTEFSRSAPVSFTLVQLARSALEEAMECDTVQMVFQLVSSPTDEATEPAEHEPQQSVGNAP
jgi:uncharacterized protein YigA (DUF484 family)